jgi:hypothetical protein
MILFSPAISRRRCRVSHDPVQPGHLAQALQGFRFITGPGQVQFLVELDGRREGAADQFSQ